MFIDSAILAIVFLGGSYATYRLIELLATDQSGIIGALFLSSVILAALFTLIAFVGTVVLTAIRSVQKEARKSRQIQERMIAVLESMEQRTRSAEQAERQRLQP